MQITHGPKLLQVIRQVGGRDEVQRRHAVRTQIGAEVSQVSAVRVESGVCKPSFHTGEGQELMNPSVEVGGRVDSR